MADEAAWPSLEPLLSLEPLAAEKYAFQDKLTFGLLLVLGPPGVSCACISFYPSVLYWIGSAGLVVPAATVLWILAGHNLLLRGLLRRRTAVILVFVLPTFALMAVAHAHKVAALSVHTELDAQDCVSFPGKRRLDLAWQAAREILDRCIDAESDSAQAPREEVRQVTSVTRCPGYAEGSLRWGREWRYLEALESEHRCAGWCKLETPVWQMFPDTDPPHDKCSLVAANMMGGEVYRTSRQVVYYCVLVMVTLGILFSMVEL